MEGSRVVTGIGIAVLAVAVGVVWWALVTGGFGQVDAGVTVGAIVALVAAIDAFRRRSGRRDDNGRRSAD